MRKTLLITFALLVSACEQAASPPAGDDPALFGAAEDQLFWSVEQKIVGFRNMDKITWTRPVPAGGVPYAFGRDEVDLSDVEFEIAGEAWSVDRYVHERNVVGLIVVKDAVIQYERYERGNDENSRWLSYSVAKSVTSLLVGAAIADGFIESVDDSVTKYLPALRDSSYDASSVRNVLQMASGVEWGEDYADPDDDINQAPWATDAMHEYLRHKPRDSEPGTKFNYNTAETNIVGDIVRSATGKDLSSYLSEKIWQPFGMQADGYWALVEEGGAEFGGSSLNATLRDYARIGQFVLNDGVVADGTRVLPDGWIAESTAPSVGSSRYGYLWWLRDEGVFAASGIFGQGIYIDPKTGTIVAINSAREHASRSEDWAVHYAMIEALVDAVNPRGDE